MNVFKFPGLMLRETLKVNWVPADIWTWLLISLTKINRLIGLYKLIILDLVKVLPVDVFELSNPNSVANVLRLENNNANVWRVALHQM